MQKIMFDNKYGLTDAVLQGRKTMTRRIAFDGEIEDFNTDYIIDGVDKGRLALCDGILIVAKSKYRIGEVLAVAQCYKNACKEAEFNTYDKALAKILLGKRREKGWCNKMFVRADLMPHQIRITGIDVEQLQDIEPADCIREGIRIVAKYSGLFHTFTQPKGIVQLWHNARVAFSALIDKISGKGTWQRNPYVFVYTFELIK